jgi:hypothetical protein
MLKDQGKSRVYLVFYLIRSFAVEWEKPENKGVGGCPPPYFRYLFANCVSGEENQRDEEAMARARTRRARTGEQQAPTNG